MISRGWMDGRSWGRQGNGLVRLRAIGMQGDRCMREIGRHVLRGYFDRTSRKDGNATSIWAQCGVGVQPGGDLQ